MTDNNGHVDGDDLQAGAVLKPTAAFAELRARFGAEIDRALPAGWEAAQPDLRTLAERERDDVAQLALRCDNLVDALEVAHRRIAAAELALTRRMDGIVEMLATHRAEMAGLRSWVMGVLEWREGIEQRVRGDRGLEARVRDLEKTLAFVELTLRISANPKTPDRLQEIEGVICKMTKVLEVITELLTTQTQK